MIPGYTDDENHLKQAAEFIGKLKSVEKVEVLPYHNMGEYKWEKLGEQYKLKGVRTPSEEEVKRAEKILASG